MVSSSDVAELYGMDREQPVSELDTLRSRVAELERIEGERRAAEGTLRETEERYRHLLELGSDAVVVHREGKVAYANAAAVSLLGAYDASQLLGTEIRALLHTAPECEPEEQMVVDDSPCPSHARRKALRLDGSIIDVEVAGSRVSFEGRDAVQLVLRDTRRCRETEEALRVKTAQLTAVTGAMTAFVETEDWHKASAAILRSALTQTASEYGFVGVVVEGPVLRILAHEGIRWDEVLGRKLYEDAIRTYRQTGYLEFAGLLNLFGRVITDRRAVISNDPATDPRSGGLPPGHPPLRCFMGVPVFKSMNVVGMIGIANRPGGYSGAELEKIDILCRAMSVLFDSYRRQEREAALERRQRDVERALRSSEERLLIAGGAAHEFNDLLTSMLAHAGIALAETPEDSPLRPHLEKIETAGWRAVELTSDLLSCSERAPSDPASPVSDEVP